MKEWVGRSVYLLGVLDPLPAGRIEVGPRVDLDTYTVDTQHMTEDLKRVHSTSQSQGCITIMRQLPFPLVLSEWQREMCPLHASTQRDQEGTTSNNNNNDIKK